MRVLLLALVLLAGCTEPEPQVGEIWGNGSVAGEVIEIGPVLRLETRYASDDVFVYAEPRFEGEAIAIRDADLGTVYIIPLDSLEGRYRRY